MSYTRIREVVIGLFKDVVIDVSVFGVHSLCSGGATAAANAGVPDQHFSIMDAGDLRLLRMVMLRTH